MEAPTRPSTVVGVLATEPPVTNIGGYAIPQEDQRCRIIGVGLARDGVVGLHEEWMVQGTVYYLAWYKSRPAWMVGGVGGKGFAHFLAHGPGRYATALPIGTASGAQLVPGDTYALVPVDGEPQWELHHMASAAGRKI